MAQGGAGEQGKRGIVRHAAAAGFYHDAAMAVAHVFAQANIRQHQKVRQMFFEQAHRLLHDAAARISAGSLFILGLWNPKQ
jgi:hypothetical protein